MIEDGRRGEHAARIGSSLYVLCPIAAAVRSGLFTGMEPMLLQILIDNPLLTFCIVAALRALAVASA